MLGQPDSCVLKLAIQLRLGIDVIDKRYPRRGFTTTRSRRQRLGKGNWDFPLPITGCCTGSLSGQHKIQTILGATCAFDSLR